MCAIQQRSNELSEKTQEQSKMAVKVEKAIAINNRLKAKNVNVNLAK